MMKATGDTYTNNAAYTPIPQTDAHLNAPSLNHQPQSPASSSRRNSPRSGEQPHRSAPRTAEHNLRRDLPDNSRYIPSGTGKVIAIAAYAKIDKVFSNPQEVTAEDFTNIIQQYLVSEDYKKKKESDSFGDSNIHVPSLHRKTIDAVILALKENKSIPLDEKSGIIRQIIDCIPKLSSADDARVQDKEQNQVVFSSMRQLFTKMEETGTLPVMLDMSGIISLLPNMANLLDGLCKFRYPVKSQGLFSFHPEYEAKALYEGCKLLGLLLENLHKSLGALLGGTEEIRDLYLTNSRNAVLTLSKMIDSSEYSLNKSEKKEVYSILHSWICSLVLHCSMALLGAPEAAHKPLPKMCNDSNEGKNNSLSAVYKMLEHHIRNHSTFPDANTLMREIMLAETLPEPAKIH